MQKPIRPKSEAGECCCPSGCESGIPRRDFIKIIAAGAAAASTMPAMAGPFTRKDFEKLVPANKKLSPEWVKSLFARGTPEVCTGEKLKYIGLPIGGLCAGQLYLGGDGKLWHWDIFNKHMGTGAAHYANPMLPESPVEQGFTLKVGDVATPLEKFSGISFRGEYPFGIVEYREKDIAVTLEAFSPFIPLNTDDSSLPATVMRFTVKNTGSGKLDTELTGHLAKTGMFGRIVPGKGFTFLECAPIKSVASTKPDIVFEDWSKNTYQGWKVEGTAFGSGPVKKSAIRRHQGDVGGDTARVVNSHASAPGNDIGTKDNATGKLTSRPFKIERNFIKFWIGGGRVKTKTCLNLVVAGKVAHSATGSGSNRMELLTFDVGNLKGQEAVIEIVDAQKGAWGNIGVGKITFSDSYSNSGKPEEEPGFGTIGLALLGEAPDVSGPSSRSPSDASAVDGAARGQQTLGRKLALAPGASEVVTFAIAWHFPNLTMPKLPGGRYYATKFASALAVAEYVSGNFDRLYRETKLWRDTWYDSTLPYWFLDRTMLNTSILATSTCYRFKNGRFYGWEGVGCCAGTCAHVWHYAHAPARLFPDLERILREQVDFGLAMQSDGAIYFRGEHNNIPAIDAQAGAILRALREHQMTADNAFLKRNWQGIKRATQWLIKKDGNGDGIIAGNQHNTLDADWFGPVAWLSGLYIAALDAAAVMADEVGDASFARQCRGISSHGRQNIVARLFDGEYFINKPDPKHLNAINSGSGCEIDQVMGQSWAWQVGLPRVLPEKETRSALRALWNYNFTPDVGPYRAKYKSGRWYAMPGEAGLLMCTFPRSDWDFRQACGVGNAKPGFAGYFNECMNGFEYQAAGHMIWEGMVLEGLAVTRAVHDRYAPNRRNPYNEIECGDHYARSMASYGVFLAACGFEYDGPKCRIGFAPRLTPENFKAAFTAAEGWGTYRQKYDGTKLTARLEVKHGRLRLQEIRLAPPPGAAPTRADIAIGDRAVQAKLKMAGDRAVVTLAAPQEIDAGAAMSVTLS